MKKAWITILALVLATFAFSAFAQDDYNWEPYDSSEAIAVKYVGSGAATITITNSIVTVVDAGNSTAISLTPAYTIADLTAAIGACTNAAGAQNFLCKRWAAIDTDTVSNMFITATADTLTANQWEYHAKWDTSGAKHYDVVPGHLMPDNQVQGGFLIDAVTGEPDGTGNVTLGVYEDNTLIWKQTIASPQYVSALVAATNTAVNTVTLFEPLGIRAKANKRYLVRATRASTATTGGIGILLK